MTNRSTNGPAPLISHTPPTRWDYHFEVSHPDFPHLMLLVEVLDEGCPGDMLTPADPGDYNIVGWWRDDDNVAARVQRFDCPAHVEAAIHNHFHGRNQ